MFANESGLIGCSHIASILEPPLITLSLAHFQDYFIGNLGHSFMSLSPAALNISGLVQRSSLGFPRLQKLFMYTCGCVSSFILYFAMKNFRSFSDDFHNFCLKDDRKYAELDTYI